MNYLAWHFYIAPKFILTLIYNYLLFVGHLFSIKIILKTLFSPWKREIIAVEKPGFNLADAFNTFSFNIISRLIGAAVRIMTLLTSLVFFMFVIIFGLTFFIYWFLIPIFSLPVFFLTQNKNDSKKREKFILSHLEDTKDEKSISEANNWYDKTKQEEKKSEEFWTRENLLSTPGIGKDWAYGYTPTLTRLTTDLSDSVFLPSDLIAREKEMEILQRILSKEENPNVLLVGEMGVGLKTIAITLSKLISSGTCSPSLLYKRVLMLDLDLLLAKTPAETRQNLIAVLEEAKKAGNIILVIPSFDQFITDEAEHINLTDVMSQHLNSNQLQIIGVLSPHSYQKSALPNQTLGNLFEKIDINEPSKETTVEILKNKAHKLENKYKIIPTYESLVEIVRQSEDLVYDVPFPQKAIDILEEAFVFARTKGKTRIMASDIDEILSEKTKLPLGELETNEKDILKNLEQLLHERIVGQDNAIVKVAQALRRKRTGVGTDDSPIGTFLFLGSTGVGKTETAKALAQAYFGDEKNLIRLDMSQFQTETDVEKLIGTAESPGILTSKVRENPFTVLLLDEFEKASPKILNLFLSVLDEGYITDGGGKNVSFKNTIIIATSNAGSEFIRERLQSGNFSTLDKELTEYLLANKIFSPELINRFDAVIFYKPLTKEELEQITQLMINKLSKKLLEEQGIRLTISYQTIKMLSEKGYDPTYGARNLERTIQEEIENKVASKIIDGSIKKDSQAEISF